MTLEIFNIPRYWALTKLYKQIVNKKKNLRSRVTLEIFNIPRYWALTNLQSSDFGDFQYTSLLGAYNRLVKIFWIKNSPQVQCAVEYKLVGRIIYISLIAKRVIIGNELR